ncbi:MAG: hypothetical protein ABL931_24285, partial [Usitatibacteraceae bacterium]
GAYAAWVAPAARSDEFSRQLYADFSVWVVAAALSIAVGAIVSFFVLRSERKWLGVLAVAVGTIVAMEFIERGYEKISPLQSGYAVSEAIKPHLQPETRLYSVENYEQSLPFYLRRTLTLVNYVDEFEMGQKSEPQKSIAKLSDFPAAWNAPGSAIAIIPPSNVDKMRALGIEFDLIHIDPRRAAIKKK